MTVVDQGNVNGPLDRFALRVSQMPFLKQMDVGIYPRPILGVGGVAIEVVRVFHCEPYAYGYGGVGEKARERSSENAVERCPWFALPYLM